MQPSSQPELVWFSGDAVPGRRRRPPSWGVLSTPRERGARESRPLRLRTGRDGGDGGEQRPAAHRWPVPAGRAGRACRAPPRARYDEHAGEPGLGGGDGAGRPIDRRPPRPAASTYRWSPAVTPCSLRWAAPPDPPKRRKGRAEMRGPLLGCGFGSGEAPAASPPPAKPVYFSSGSGYRLQGLIGRRCSSGRRSYPRSRRGR